VAELDRERILSNVDELDSYLAELRPIAPGDFSEDVISWYPVSVWGCRRRRKIFFES
jgi:hypothetical protein